MNKQALFKAARMAAANPKSLSAALNKKASIQKQAELLKVATAIKALYNLKVASVDLMDQAQRDEDLASFLQSR